MACVTSSGNAAVCSRTGARWVGLRSEELGRVVIRLGWDESEMVWNELDVI